MKKADLLDRKILRIISIDARRSFKEIAAHCGVSRAAIHQRVVRMIEKGIITGSGYQVSPKFLGFGTCTYIGIKLERGSMYKQTVDQLNKIPEIVECHFTTGPYTVLVKLYSRDNEHLKDLLNNKIQEIPGVTSVEPAIEPRGVQDISMHLNLKKSQEEQRIIYTDKVDISNTIFPMNKDWNKDWYGPIKIPKKGDIIDINLETIPMYSKLIREYENNILEVKGNQIFINKVAADKYEVKQNYYFMMGDNRDASLDSRYFGFVPETHIMGSPMFTWLSLEGSFTDNNSSYQANGWRIRWDRMFKATNTGEANKTSYWWVAAILMGIFFGWDYIMKFVKKKKNED